MSAGHPPLSRLASLLLRGERGEVILGDLEEGWRQRLSEGVPERRARAWYRRQLWASAFALARAPRDRQRARASKRRGPSSHLLNDLGFAVKSLWRRPGFALPIVATLALGMGVSATVFSVVEAVLMRPPSFAEPDELMMIWNRQLEDTDAANLLSGPDFMDLSHRSRTLEGVAAMNEVIVAPVLGTESPSFARLAPVSANLFEVLGVPAMLGRTFGSADQAPLDPEASSGRAPEPVILSHDYWMRAFGGDADVVGRSLRTFVSDKIVVGVLPPGFRLVLPASAGVGDDLGAAIDMWSTYRTDYREWERDGRALLVIARMAEGASIAAVRGELDNLARDLRAEHALHREHRFALGAEPLVAEASSHLRPLLLLLSAAVLCVLLVACVNASGLLLARVVERSDELSIRTALGAGRLTLARLVLIESLALAGVAGVLAVAVALGGMELLKWLSPAGLPQADDLDLNRPVLVFSLLVVPLAAIVAGMVPTLRAGLTGREQLQMRGAGRAAAHRRLGEGLSAAQIALTVLLLVGTGLMLRSFAELQQVPLGFEPQGVLSVDFSTIGQPPDWTAETAALEWVERRRHQERELSQSLRQLPGVRAAGAVFPVPLNGVYARTCAYSLSAEGREQPKGVAYFRNVWPGYFESMGIPLLRGRDFVYDDDQPNLVEWELGDVDERTDSPRVVIDARLAAKLWPGESAVGRRLTFSTTTNIEHDAEVIGIVPFVPQGGIEDTLETIYIPRSYYRSQELTLTLKVDADTSAARKRITETVHRIFPDSPLEFRPMEDYVSEALAPTRFVLTLLAVFAGSALFLASIGLYGTMALLVRTRTNEIGVHIAMGAPPPSIGRRIVARSVGLAAVGAVAGLGAAFVLSRFLEAHLVEVSARDPGSFALAALVQLVVAGLAAWVPARRAAGVDPVTALRID